MTNKAKHRDNYLNLPGKRKASTKQAIDSSYTIAQPVYKNIDLFVLTGGQRKLDIERKLKPVNAKQAKYEVSAIGQKELTANYKRKQEIKAYYHQ